MVYLRHGRLEAISSGPFIHVVEERGGGQDGGGKDGGEVGGKEDSNAGWLLQFSCAALNGHSKSVHSVAFSPDGTRFASGSEDTSIKVWDVSTKVCIVTLNGHSDSVRSVAFSPDGIRLASGSKDSTIKVWDLSTKECVATLNEHVNSVYSVAFFPDGTRLATGGGDETVKVWDLSTMMCMHTLSGFGGPVYSVAFSPDSTCLASGSRDMTIKVWDLSTMAYVATLKGHGDTVHSVAFSLHGTRLASGSWDNTIKLWDLSTMTCIATLNGHRMPVRSVAFFPDGTRLASGSGDDSIKVWDLATKACVATLNGHRMPVSSVALSPDGTRLISGSMAMTIKAWDLSTKSCIATLNGHTDSVSSVAISPDGNHLATGSWDKTIKVWDLSTKACVATLTEPSNTDHSQGILASAFTRKGILIAFLSFVTDESFPYSPSWNAAVGACHCAVAEEPPVGPFHYLLSVSQLGHCGLWYSRNAGQSQPASGKSQLSMDGSSSTGGWTFVDSFDLLTSARGRLISSANISFDGGWLEIHVGPESQRRWLGGRLDEALNAFGALIDQVEGVQGTKGEDLEERDRRRSNPQLFAHWDTIASTIQRLPSSMMELKWDATLTSTFASSIVDPQHYLESVGKLQASVTLTAPFMELYRKVSIMFPLADPQAASPSPLPYQLAAEAVVRFKKEILAPLLLAKRKLRRCREDIAGHLSLREEVPSTTLEDQGLFEAQVQELAARFQPAYEELTTVIRPGFPELRGMIQEIDSLCGMGKLRMDVHLADFSELPPMHPSAPNVLRATTVQSSQTAPKNLKPVYILKKFAADKKDDFYREVEVMQSAKQLDSMPHPNVAMVEFAFEEGIGDGVAYYIAMPQYECDSMAWFGKQILETNDRDAVLRALVETAEGLHCLHCTGVIHGDLKPENIMFDTDSKTARPKLIDFNFSSIDQKTYALLKLKTAALGASVGYTPPEFIDGRTTSRTRESDVYSLGQTYRVLLGMAPHPTATATETATSAGQPGMEQQDKLKRAVKVLLGDDVFDELVQLFQQMTEVAPEKRISLTSGGQRRDASGSSAGSSPAPTSSPSSVLDVLNLLKAGRVKELTPCALM